MIKLMVDYVKRPNIYYHLNWWK